MSLEDKLVLEMTYNSVVQSHAKYSDLMNINWSKLYMTACRNNIAPFLFDEAIRCNENSVIDESIIQNWKQQTMYISLTEYRKNYALRQILKAANEKKLSLIVFKGPVLANLYPNYALRTSCDTDILIKEEEKDSIFEIVEEIGYVRIMESEDNVYTFRSDAYDHNLELHTTLYGQHTGPRIDLLNAMDLTREDTLIREEVCGTTVTTLGYVEHLIYLMFHLTKHFTLEGIALRHIVDIVFYINHYIEKISLDHFWDAMDRLGYVSSCDVFFSVGIRYMGLDARILQGHKLVEVKICEDLLNDVMNQDDDQDETKQIFQLWGIMEPYMVGVTKKRQSAGKNYLTLLKPIDKKYEYARKHKILLPICWIHKVGSYFHSKYILNKAIYTPMEKVKVAESRIELLQEIGLIEKL